MKRALTALAALLVCTACAPLSSSTPAEPSPSTSAASPATLSAGGKPQAPGGTAPATLGIPWDEASKTAALETACAGKSPRTLSLCGKKKTRVSNDAGP